MPTPSKQEYVYLIGSSKFGWYKIGKSRRPSIRVSELGILLPFRVALFGLWSTCKGLTTERLMHEKYAEYAINGEWFGIPLQDVVKMLREGQPFDSLLVYSVFDPQTYSAGNAVGAGADFTNMEEDKIVTSHQFRTAKGKIRREFQANWFASRGLSGSQEDWDEHAQQIHADFKEAFKHLTPEQFAFAGVHVL